MMHPTVYTIIVTYNGSKWIDNCFGSLINSSIPVKILAIDNASTDGTPQIIRERFPQVEVIETGQNLGFGKANNIGLKRVLDENADYTFLLNQDAWVEPDTIEKLIDESKKHREYGILSPIHLNGSGNAIDPKFGAALINQNNTFFNDHLFNKPQIIYDAIFINAAVWLIPKVTLKIVGGFNPHFFMYGEDGDFCNRVLYHKFKIGIVNDCFAFHSRDNFHFKKRPFLSEIKFMVQEVLQYYREQYYKFDIPRKTILKHFIIYHFLEKTFYHLIRFQLSKFIGYYLGLFLFVLKISETINTKKNIKVANPSFLR